MDFFLIILIGLLPSTLWLLFFLRKDVHPESKAMILKVFFAGVLAAPIAVFVETGIQEGLLALNLSQGLFFFSHLFLAVALTEEILKYLVVRTLVLSHHEFDEPVDSMLYMIISALGFAALENILILLSQTILHQPFGETLTLVTYRFLTATFFHALASAVVGYFLALSICYTKNQVKLISIGLGSATILHGLYDLSVIRIFQNLIEINKKVVVVNYSYFIAFSLLLFIILIGLAFFVTSSFKKLKKIKSVCLPDFVLTNSRRAGKI
jgi:RsiW-degrading membrane proteinase PrsW (M82 family)